MRTLTPVRRLVLTMVCLAAALALAGCGSSTTKTDTTASTATENTTQSTATDAAGGGGDATSGTSTTSSKDVTCANVDQALVAKHDPRKLPVAKRADMFSGETPSDVLPATSACVVHVVTNKGAFDIDVDAKAAPIAASNFVFLARSGYYDGISFHRIMKGFMIQTGDPQGTGTGGPGYELQDDKNISGEYTPGTVAMANAGPNTGGSQFFIVDGTQVQLPPNYVIFGHVAAKGMGVVHAIANTPVGPSDQGEPSKPKSPVTITKMTVTG